MPREPIRVRRIFQPPLMRGKVSWEISRRFHRLCPGRGQVAHVLRTLPPVAATGIATRALPLDLHVLSLPLAFILSQDQTLLCIYSSLYITNSLSLSPLPLYFKKSTLSFLLVLLVLAVLACTYLSVFSMILTLPFSKGLQRYTTFLNRQNFFAFFLRCDVNLQDTYIKKQSGWRTTSLPSLATRR